MMRTMCSLAEEILTAVSQRWNRVIRRMLSEQNIDAIITSAVEKLMAIVSCMGAVCGAVCGL